MKLARPPILPKKRAVRARAWRSGAIQTFFVQKRFEPRSVIATSSSPANEC
jgi:hypothetical protein